MASYKTGELGNSELEKRVTPHEDTKWDYVKSQWRVMIFTSSPSGELWYLREKLRQVPVASYDIHAKSQGRVVIFSGELGVPYTPYGTWIALL